MCEEIIVPLFSYDVKGQKVDINSIEGDICYVSSKIVGAASSEIAIYKEKMSQLTQSGKKIINISMLNREAINSTMTFIDGLLKDDNLQDKDKWEKVYSTFSLELEKRNQK